MLNPNYTNKVSDLSNENVLPIVVQDCRSTDLILPVENEVTCINSNKNVDPKVLKKKGTSNLETLMHIIKANIGTGVLAMPLAFKNAGLILSGITLWIMAIICVHCMHILLNCYQHITLNLSKQLDGKKLPDSIGYEDVVYYVAKENSKPGSRLPKITKIIVSIFLVIGQLGFCCVYLVFMPTNLKQVIDFYHPENKFTIEIIMSILLIPLALFCLIKDLKILAPFSTLANFLMIVSIIIIIFYLFIDGSLKPMNQLEMVAPFSDWPIYFSSAIYAFEGISLVLPVHHEMRNKESFTPWNGVLNTGMTLVAVMYFSVGFFGYMKYGSDSMASITLNLPVTNVLFQIIKILFTIAIFISYNLQFYVAAEIIWSAIYRSSKYLQSLSVINDGTVINSQSGCLTPARKLSLFQNGARIFLVLFTFLLAVSIPKIDLFISLVGAVASSTLAIIIPPVLDMIVFWSKSNKSVVKLIKNLLICLFGIYIFVAGTLVSVEDIVNYFLKK